MKTKKLFLMAAMLLMSVCLFAQSKYLYIGPVEPTVENYKTIATEVASYNDQYEYENNTREKCYVYVLVAEDISVSIRDPALGGIVDTLELTSANIPGHKVVRTYSRLANGGRDIIDLGDEWKHFYLGTTQPTTDNYETLTPAFSSLSEMNGATIHVPSSGKIYLLVPYSDSPTKKQLKYAFIDNEGNTVAPTERYCDYTSIYRHYIWELSFEPGTVLKYNDLKGDINYDGSVDVGDIMSVINIMAEGSNNSIGDLNGDGNVDVGDIMAIINIMAGQ